MTKRLQRECRSAGMLQGIPPAPPGKRQAVLISEHNPGGATPVGGRRARAPSVEEEARARR